MNNYHPMNFDPCSNCVYNKDNINMMNMNMQMPPVPVMPQMEQPLTELEPWEAMYPDIYHKVYPLVKQHCDVKEHEYNMMYKPCREDIDKMAEDICMKINLDIDVNSKGNKRRRHRNNDEEDDLAFRRYGRRDMLSDLVKILLIRELIGRRRPHHYWGY